MKIFLVRIEHSFKYLTYNVRTSYYKLKLNIFFNQVTQNQHYCNALRRISDCMLLIRISKHNKSKIKNL